MKLGIFIYFFKAVFSWAGTNFERKFLLLAVTLFLETEPLFPLLVWFTDKRPVTNRPQQPDPTPEGYESMNAKGLSGLVLKFSLCARIIWCEYQVTSL